MILDEIKKLQEKGIKAADEKIKSLKATVEEAEKVKQQLIDQQKRKG